MPRTFESLHALQDEMVAQTALVTGDRDHALALAEFDHVVLFARVSADGVRWAPDMRAPAVENLLDLRVFGPLAEWRLWRIDDDTFGERTLRDDGQDAFDEYTVLWGTKAKPVSDGWTEITEARGFRLLVPLDVAGDLYGRGGALYLHVRHYPLPDPDTNLACVADSRLVALLKGTDLPEDAHA